MELLKLDFLFHRKIMLQNKSPEDRTLPKVPASSKTLIC